MLYMPSSSFKFLKVIVITETLVFSKFFTIYYVERVYKKVIEYYTINVISF